MEFATLSFVNGELVFHAFTDEEIDQLLLHENVASTKSAPSSSSS